MRCPACSGELSSGRIPFLLIWLPYFAIETFMRRKWSASMVSRSRVLAGNVRDSLVGRDPLVGFTSLVFIGLIAAEASWFRKSPRYRANGDQWPDHTGR